jgi:ABC-type lipoprotein release transport system permease subunit
MFDLDSAIKKWRRTLYKNEALEDGYIAELESHLRDEIEMHIGQGHSPEAAFFLAIESIGAPAAIGSEYFKTDARSALGIPPPQKNLWFAPALGWNYFKIAMRRFRRQKIYSLINISGLAVGMTCCILMFIWVQHEWSFDRFHENGEDIFRIISRIETSEQTSLNARTPTPLGPYLEKTYPEVIRTVRFQGFDGWRVKSEGKTFHNDNLGTADPGFFKMFTFTSIHGDPKTALEGRYSIVVTESMARKYFGEADPMGKVISLGHDYTVTAVVEDVPSNSHLHFDCIFPIINMSDYWHEDFESWRRVRFYTYVQLRKNSSPGEFDRKIAGAVRENMPQARSTLFLQPLKDVHLRSRFEWDLDNYAQGNLNDVVIFALTAVGILLLACINFMNLSTARAAGRSKEVGMRKVAGAYRLDLVKQFFGESLLMAAFALFFAVLMTEALLPGFNALTGKALDLDPAANRGLLLGLLTVTLATGLLAGSYPALLLSSFQPVKVLKGTLASRRSTGAFLRRTLVVVQFSGTVILLFFTLLIYRQLRFIQNKDLGFDKNHILTFHNYHDDADVIRNTFLPIPGVERLTLSQPPGRLLGVPDIAWEGKDPGQDLLLYPVHVDYDYLDTFRMEMAEGRFFSKEFPTDATQAVVVNESAVQAMGLESPLGTRLTYRDRQAVIIGVIEDFHHSSLHNPIEPMVFWGPEESPYTCVRISPQNVPQTLKALEVAWKTIIKNYPWQYEFLDKRIDDFYRTEYRTAEVLRYFTILAVFIAGMGLFGLSAYTTEQRTKEIGIRKVLGASASGIVLMLSKEFSRWVVISSVLAWPVGYILARSWLQGYAYRIVPGWKLFLMSTALALGVAMVTVSYQSLKAALADPVDALRYE